MITITRREALLLRRVLRRRALGLAPHGPIAPLVLRVDPDAGLRVRFHHGDLAVECLLPRSRRPAEVAAIPLEILKTLKAADDSPVLIAAESPTRTSVAWDDSGFPESALHAVPSLRSRRPHPAEPPAWADAPAALLDALAASPDDPAPGLLCLYDDCAAEADTGRVLARLPRGQFFPWEGGVLVRAAPVFARPELPRSAPLRLGLTETHLVVRAGMWTVWAALRDEDDLEAE